MPITTDKLKQYPNPVFIETGTYRGQGVVAAVEAGFKTIYSMDIDNINSAKAKKHIGRNTGVHLYAGSSTDILPEILKAAAGVRVTFWLDAHPPGRLTFDTATPVQQELAVIAKYLADVPGCFVLIDDMRMFTSEDQERIHVRLEKMGAIQVTRIDGVKPNDIMVGRF